MTHESILEKLQPVFRDVFDNDEIIVTDSSTAADIEEWDSLAHMQLISAVEVEFGIKFNIGEINSFANVGEMVESIAKHASK